MATVHQCDRCLLTGVAVTTTLGKDLCVACQAAFVEWVDAGARASSIEACERATYGKRWGQVEALCQRYGHVTSALLFKHFGMNRSSATWYLHAIKRQGKLDFHGAGLFTIPKRAEAAE